MSCKCSHVLDHDTLISAQKSWFTSRRKISGGVFRRATHTYCGAYWTTYFETKWAKSRRECTWMISHLQITHLMLIKVVELHTKCNMDCKLDEMVLMITRMYLYLYSFIHSVLLRLCRRTGMMCKAIDTNSRRLEGEAFITLCGFHDVIGFLTRRPSFLQF